MCDLSPNGLVFDFSSRALASSALGVLTPVLQFLYDVY